MYFALDPDQRRLQDAARSWAATHATEGAVRRVLATPDAFDAAAWKQLGAALGAVRPAGGCPASTRARLIEAVAVIEVLAGALYPGPYLGTTVAVAVLDAVAPDDPASARRPGLAAGELLVTAAWPRTRADHLSARDGPGGAEIGGELATVVDSAHADRLLCSDGSAWYEVAAGARGLAVRPEQAFDQTRRLARVRLDATPARPITTTEPGDDVLARAALVERIAVAAEDTAVARHCLDAGLAYARRRHQFGRPIGSFQALQHWFADTASAVECAWGATYQAAWDAEQSAAEAERSSRLAAATAGDAAVAAAEQFMQVSGGVGFTWDNPAHLYLKRAKGNRLLFGHPDGHRERLGELLGL